MPALDLFRRASKRPTLKERTAALRARIVRLTRKPAEADPGRRAVMKGTMAAAVVVPLPALPVLISPAAAAAAGPHPDQALLDAEAAYLAANARHEALSEASSEAHDAMRAALGPCPEELLLADWEDRAFVSPWRGGLVRRLPTRIVPYIGESWRNPDFAWKAEGLRQAIALAPGAFGRAGRTPHLIRHWRSLMPIASAHDARCEALDRRFRCTELSAESRAAQTAMHRARARLHRMAPATTVEGLAVHVRDLAETAWYDGNTAYTALLLSAAALTGVGLRQSDFDAAGWASSWRAVGGRIEWRTDDEAWAFIAPSTKAASPERAAETRRLSDERGRNGAVIDRWLDAERARG